MKCVVGMGVLACCAIICGPLLDLYAGSSTCEEEDGTSDFQCACMYVYMY